MTPSVLKLYVFLFFLSNSLVKVLESFLFFSFKLPESSFKIFSLLFSIILLFVVLMSHSSKIDDLSFSLFLKFLLFNLFSLSGFFLVLSFDLILHKSSLYVVLDVRLFALKSLEFLLRSFFLFNLVLSLNSFSPQMYNFLSIPLNSICILQSFQVI